MSNQEKFISQLPEIKRLKILRYKKKYDKTSKQQPIQRKNESLSSNWHSKIQSRVEEIQWFGILEAGPKLWRN